MTLAGSPAVSTRGATQPTGDPGHKRLRDGTDRAASLEETAARVGRVMEAVGVTRVADITGLDCVGIPVAAAYRPNARSVSVSQGKGLTREGARVSAVMEAIEGFHAEHVSNPLRLAAVEEMASRSDVIDLGRLPRTITPLGDGAKLLWIEGRDLTKQEPCWVPIEVVHTDFTSPVVGCSGAFMMSSNGLASGNHLLEATSHGICEVVERDANTLWYFAAKAHREARRVALDSVSDPVALQVLARFEAADLAVAVWETTSDVGIPSFYCKIADRQDRGWFPLPPTPGSGCHPRREVALAGALMEAAQGRLTRIAAVREDLDDKLYTPKETHARNQRFLVEASQSVGARSFLAAPTFDAPTFAEDVDWELERLAQGGLPSAVVVDLTRPDLGVPVVRVIVPGLEGIVDLSSYSPGRRADAWRAAQGTT